MRRNNNWKNYWGEEDKENKALERVERLERIIAYANFNEENMPKLVKNELNTLRESIEEDIDYKKLLTEKLREEIHKILHQKGVNYVSDENKNKIFSVKDNNIYRYYSNYKPSLNNIVNNFKFMPIEDNELESIIKDINENEEDVDYKEMYYRLID